METKICAVCGKEFIPIGHRAKYCEGCRLEKKKSYLKAYHKAYNQSEKYKAYQKAYNQSEKGKATRKAQQKAYRQSEKGKAVQNAYRQSEKGKAWEKAYFQSEKAKAYKKSRQKYISGNMTSCYLNHLGIPTELHELKRAQLQLLRACRE